jgi:hypothetical protein
MEGTGCFAAVLQLVKNGMHEPFLVIDALLQGDHGLCSANTINIVYPENNIFGMIGILSPNLTEDIELSGSDVRDCHVRNLIQSF